MAQTVILAEQTRSFALYESFGLYGATATDKAELIVGETYSVVWDNETYICTAQDSSAVLPESVLIGNASAFGLSGNNEPFIILSASDAALSDIVSLTDTEAGCTHTVAIYQGETDSGGDDESGSGDEIVLKYFSGEEKKFSGVEMVELNTSDGGTQLFSKGEAVENVPIVLDFSEGDQLVTAPDGTLVKSVVIQKPSNLIPENIKRGENIAGIDGVASGNLTTLSVTKNGMYAPSNDFDPLGGTYRFKASYTQEYLSSLYAEASAVYEFPMNDFATGAFAIDNNDEEGNGLAIVRFMLGEAPFYGLMKECGEPKFWVPVEVATALGQSAEGWYAVVDANAMTFAPSDVPDYPIVESASYTVSIDDIALLFDSDGYDGYSSVEVNVQAETEDVTVVPDFSGGDILVEPSEDKLISSVTITKPETLTAENIAAGVDIAGIVGTHQGGGGGGNLACKEKTVNFYDWDGTLLYSYTKAEAMALTELPEFPTSEQFGTATAWNWTLSEIQSSLSGRYWIDVGALYTIEHSKVFISLTDSANLTITIEFGATSGLSAWSGDLLWGDGTQSSVSVSKGGSQEVSHTYSNIGDYTIELDTNREHQIFSFSGATTAIRKVWLGKNCRYNTSNFGTNIKEIIASDGCTGFIAPTSTSNYLEFLIFPPVNNGMSRFNGFKSLKLLSLPYSIINSSNYSNFHYNNYNLKRARYWGSSFTSSNFYSCCGLKAVHLLNVQTISNAVGDYCYSLETVILPSTLTKISANFFKDSLNAKFYVPDDKVDTFKAMTYMAVHKDRIFPISQIPEQIL